MHQLDTARRLRPGDRTYVRAPSGSPNRALAPLRRLVAWPPVVRLRNRYARQLEFLAARLNQTAALGLVLTIQLVLLGLLGAAFSAVTEDVVTSDELVRLDDPISRLLVEHR